ncbi:DNA primase large subunit [Candidatus Caldarchaeum subterraneum]|uniref:DNA primase large subunit n=1 Tax=Caldiarchaeum subterraneum TaxID=311458 RepID=E6N614_CALS0|nr:DNA primase large subunit [Candidatus Caldarchaeum subterraneum]BAJ49440.1 DNA primase large subunit [Candidatus Caldarchaeum subterraneum]BAJ50606.1 DNA primase large subunit [Candidatus Caldarchaeum subterraneum]
MIASTIADNWLMRRWALAESARVERLLHSEDTATFEFIVGRLLNVQKDGDEYMIRFTDYLRLAQDLTRELSWKLVNQKLSRGWVYLTRTRLTRLLRQYLYQELVRSFETTRRLAKPPEKIAQAMAEVVKNWQRQAPATKGILPPCMIAIHERLSDTSHTENFILAAHLLSSGYTVEEVVNIFRIRSDFREDIARYQVEHIAGLRGSRVKYRPPSCQRMRELNLCVQNGRLCPPNIRNPLQYRPKQQRQTT